MGWGLIGLLGKGFYLSHGQIPNRVGQYRFDPATVSQTIGYLVKIHGSMHAVTFIWAMSNDIWEFSSVLMCGPYVHVHLN